MSLRDALAERRGSVDGRLADDQSIVALRGRFPVELPDWLIACLRKDHVIGVRFEDATNENTVFRWLSPEEMAEEATEYYPGIAVAKMGYLPIGACLLGSGDPYFLQLDGSDDPPLVRVYHDSIDADGRVCGQWRGVISDHVSSVVKRALIG